jgi:hypothetical protein
VEKSFSFFYRINSYNSKGDVAVASCCSCLMQFIACESVEAFSLSFFLFLMNSVWVHTIFQATHKTNQLLACLDVVRGRICTIRKWLRYSGGPIMLRQLIVNTWINSCVLSGSLDNRIPCTIWVPVGKLDMNTYLKCRSILLLSC